MKQSRTAAILLDTKGPEIRTGKLKDGKDVELVEGQTFTFQTTDPNFLGDATVRAGYRLSAKR